MRDPEVEIEHFECKAGIWFGEPRCRMIGIDAHPKVKRIMAPNHVEFFQAVSDWYSEVLGLPPCAVPPPATDDRNDNVTEIPSEVDDLDPTFLFSLKRCR